MPMEIMHNILATFDGELTVNHQPKAIHDMAVLMAYVAKVNSSICLQLSFSYSELTFDPNFL